MKKKIYATPEMIFIQLGNEDVITNSGGLNPADPDRPLDNDTFENMFG